MGDPKAYGSRQTTGLDRIQALVKGYNGSYLSANYLFAEPFYANIGKGSHPRRRGDELTCPGQVWITGVGDARSIETYP